MYDTELGTFSPGVVTSSGVGSAPQDTVTPPFNPADNPADLQRLNDGRVTIDRALRRLKSTLSPDSGSYASGTLTEAMRDDIGYLENLQYNIAGTTEDIVSRDRERLRGGVQNLSPKGKEYVIGMLFGLASVVAKNILWYAPAEAARNNFAAQLAFGYLGALGIEYTLLQEGQRRILEANLKAGLKDAKVSPSAFQAATQAFDMIAAPLTLTAIDKSKVEGADYGFFAGLLVGSTINSGWPSKLIKGLRNPRHTSDQELVTIDPAEIGEVKLPGGVRATKQARDLQSLLEVLPADDRLAEIHALAHTANTYRDGLPPAPEEAPPTDTRINMRTPLPASRNIDTLRTDLSARRDRLLDSQKWGWREYGTLAGSAVAYAGLYGGSTRIKNPYQRAAVKFIASTFPQGLAQLGEFAEIPGSDRFQSRFPRVYKVGKKVVGNRVVKKIIGNRVVKGAARISVPLFLEFLALQDATKDVTRGNQSHDVPDPRETTDRVIQEAFRTLEGPALAWGLGGDTPDVHNGIAALMNGAFAGGAYARDRRNAARKHSITSRNTSDISASVTPLESKNTTEFPDTPSSRANQGKEIGRRDIETPSQNMLLANPEPKINPGTPRERESSADTSVKSVNALTSTPSSGKEEESPPGFHVVVNPSDTPMTDMVWSILQKADRERLGQKSARDVQPSPMVGSAAGEWHGEDFLSMKLPSPSAASLQWRTVGQTR